MSKLFMRDDLNDNGTIHHHGSYCSSPDIICHSQVAYPKEFFKDNYNQDPNESVQLGSAVNFIYTRLKNLYTTASGGYIHLYRSRASLFMHPSIWKNNKLMTQEGKSYVTIDTTEPNQVAVANEPFIIEAIKSNLFCIVGIASQDKDPIIPDDFSNYSDFILWVKGNQNVSVRNLSLERNCTKKDYERLDNFSNPEIIPVPALFKVEAIGLPEGTVFGVKCAPLAIDDNQSINKGNILTASSICPARFDGTVTTYAILPNNVSKWPKGARLDIDVYVGLEENSDAAIYAENWEDFNSDHHELMGRSNGGHLVKIGSCSTEFI